MNTQLPSKEKVQWLHDTATEFASVGMKLTLNAEELLPFTSALLAAYEQEPVAYTEMCEITNMQATGLYLRGFPDSSQGRNIPLYANPAPSIPAVPDGYVLMPMKLTAENGAKYALSGEFHVVHRVTCHECGGEGCSDCDDDGWLEEKIMIGWDDIKDIYRAAVEACSIKSTGEGV